jgi:hypothetical protein
MSHTKEETAQSVQPTRAFQDGSHPVANPAHTPSPWRLTVDATNHDYIVRGPTDAALGRVFVGADDTFLYDARLIVTAPDLLHACKALIKHCEKLEISDIAFRADLQGTRFIVDHAEGR